MADSASNLDPETRLSAAVWTKKQTPLSLRGALGILNKNAMENTLKSSINKQIGTSWLPVRIVTNPDHRSLFNDGYDMMLLAIRIEEGCTIGNRQVVEGEKYYIERSKEEACTPVGDFILIEYTKVRVEPQATESS